MADQTAQEPRRYPGLDFLRALAIVMVVICHSATAINPRPDRPAREGELYALQLGGKGVDLFFVLSGWLLGKQLMQELRATGSIDLRRFWYRRWLRTLPAYYAVLFVQSLWQIHLGNPLNVSYFFFGQTYLTHMPYFGISWSLCVEEHFYLMVAPALWLFWRVPSSRWLAPVLLTLPLFCRTLGWYGSNYDTHIRYDPCAMGVLLAVAAVAAPRLWSWLRMLAPLLAIAGLLAASRDVVCRLHPEWGLKDQGIAEWSLICGSWVLLAASRPQWGSFLQPGIRYLAERSYAIYLCHLEALSIVKRFEFEGISFGLFLFLLLTWLLTLPLAECLYRLVEKPGMRLRERFAASRSRHHS